MVSEPQMSSETSFWFSELIQMLVVLRQTPPFLGRRCLLYAGRNVSMPRARNFGHSTPSTHLDSVSSAQSIFVLFLQYPQCLPPERSNVLPDGRPFAVRFIIEKILCRERVDQDRQMPCVHIETQQVGKEASARLSRGFPATGGRCSCRHRPRGRCRGGDCPWLLARKQGVV